MKNQTIFKRTAVSAAVVALMAAGAAQAATVQHSSFHRFTANDLVGAFDGRTFGTAGNFQDRSILCGGVGGLPACDADHNPIKGSEAGTLWPIDSEFGFIVVPFAQAFQKTIGDGVWGEGYAGNIFDAGKIIGLEVSDAETDTFKVPAPLGTWCAGIGETAVKCSTEQYVVMEHVLTCHETVAYMVGEYPARANPDDGAQALLYAPDDLDVNGDPLPGAVPLVDCANTKFDNDLFVMNDSGPINDQLMSSVGDFGALGVDPADPLTFLEPNESTILDDIAVTADYSITAKDDGKPLYRWGTLIKRPNDIRLYARMGLPAAWKDGSCDALNGGLGCRVTKGELYVRHNITNNPNDQVRPEDMENEGATGRLPGYDVDPSYGAGSWVSDVACYEGDGDFIPAGTVMMNTDMADGGADAIVGTDPYAWSEDLQEGLSNGWYTTVDREPFEWSYDTDGDGAADVSYRSPLNPIPGGTTLLSGPRWRLTPGKFGQNVPGLEVPRVNCAPPPYQKAMIKYEVGAATRTVMNMLDWDSTDDRSVIDPDPTSPTFNQPVSPLTFSSGWVDGEANDGTLICGGTEPSDPQAPDCTVITPTNPQLTAVSINGAPVSEDFDLSMYIKGDRKPTQIYYSWLILEYDDGTP